MIGIEGVICKEPTAFRHLNPLVDIVDDHIYDLAEEIVDFRLCFIVLMYLDWIKNNDWY